METLP